ncbi:MAG: hypothetical protein EB168_10085 [Euryarchaeota archaeon]|nr:hypothetical protein [Euryarchaeota archaeon]
MHREYKVLKAIKVSKDWTYTNVPGATGLSTTRAVGIGTDAPNENIQLNVVGNIESSGIVTARKGFISTESQYAVTIDFDTGGFPGGLPIGIVFNVVGIGSTTFTLV